MKFERGVLCEQGAAKKKLVFSLTTIAGRKCGYLQSGYGGGKGAFLIRSWLAGSGALAGYCAA
jgi:hypothetical protein